MQDLKNDCFHIWGNIRLKIDATEEIVRRKVCLVCGRQKLYSIRPNGHASKRRGQCEICLDKTSTTKHHLIPQSVWQVGDPNPKANLCWMCHQTVHQMANNACLRVDYNTIGKIRKSLIIQNYLRNRGRLDLNGNSVGGGLG